jgi:ABC-2 type transport system ATP-binding protein
VLDKGHIIYDGSLSRVKAMPGLRRTIVVDFPARAPIEQLQAVFGERIVFSIEGERRLIGNFAADTIQTTEVIRTVLDRYEVSDLSLAEPSIDDVIVKLYTEGSGGA